MLKEDDAWRIQITNTEMTYWIPMSQYLTLEAALNKVKKMEKVHEEFGVLLRIHNELTGESIPSEALE